MRPVPIELTQEETELVSQIDFSTDTLSPGFFDRLSASCKIAPILFKSLAARQAIPQVRLDFFFKRGHVPGSKLSHHEIFEKNGTRGEAIFAHGHFLPFLRYFVFGPALPTQVIDRFCELVDESALHIDQMSDLQKLARSAVRANPRERRSIAEEFYKLGLEVAPEFAHVVRDAAMRTRVR